MCSRNFHRNFPALIPHQMTRLCVNMWRNSLLGVSRFKSCISVCKVEGAHAAIVKIAKSNISFLDHKKIPNVLTLQSFLNVFFLCLHMYFRMYIYVMYIYEYDIFIRIRMVGRGSCVCVCVCLYSRPRLGTEQLKKTGRRGYEEEGREKKRESNRDI